MVLINFWVEFWAKIVTAREEKNGFFGSNLRRFCPKKCVQITRKTAENDVVDRKRVIKSHFSGSFSYFQVFHLMFFNPKMCFLCFLLFLLMFLGRFLDVFGCSI